MSQEHLDALCPELRAVVDDAGAAGNPVVETWTGYGQGVALDRSRPLLVAVTGDVRGRLAYLHTDDPRNGLGEVSCALHPGWSVVLPWHPDARPSGDDLGLAPYRRVS